MWNKLIIDYNQRTKEGENDERVENHSKFWWIFRLKETHNKAAAAAYYLCVLQVLMFWHPFVAALFDVEQE